ncbi:MAG: exodeoxyribonuclease VII large subunit [Myxococcales bacterium FL481]|nr:MAG: exodeoxyribonuclease VII large subunit [Myxococcales bacterium FL481]
MAQIPMQFDRPRDNGPKVYSVSQAVRGVDRRLAGLGQIWVQGEISNLHRAGSGHAYFTLKDDDAALPTAIFRSALSQLRFQLREGLAVRVFGRFGVYTAQGRFQFYGEKAEPAGLGERMVALERLKKKLATEGLFAADRKRPLPLWPRRIGIVTSADGAAVHDIIKVVGRRFPSRLLLAPARVQGDAATASLIDALTRLAAIDDVDVIIVGRGGGSSEDLWAFNDERLARAVVACPVPVVSAVGHEVDVTICDLAADVRAATPSQAGELVVPDRDQLHAHLSGARKRLAAAMWRMATDERGRCDRAARRLERAGQRVLAGQRQRIAAGHNRLQSLLRAALAGRRQQLAQLGQRLAVAHPRVGLQRNRGALTRAQEQLERALRQQLAGARLRMARAAGKLDALSPLAVLERGYAVVTDVDGRAVRDAQAANVGAGLHVTLHRGQLFARVERVEPTSSRDPSYDK